MRGPSNGNKNRNTWKTKTWGSPQPKIKCKKICWNSLNIAFKVSDNAMGGRWQKRICMGGMGDMWKNMLGYPPKNKIWGRGSKNYERGANKVFHSPLRISNDVALYLVWEPNVLCLVSCDWCWVYKVSLDLRLLMQGSWMWWNSHLLRSLCMAYHKYSLQAR